MRITICDDEEKHLAQIAAYTSEYLKKQNLDITLKEFISPHELLNYEYINGGSTIYLLDIVMEGMSGLELAQRLREYNHKALIIFLTTAREFSLEAFSVHAFSYLLKPLDKAALFAEFDKCFTYCLPLQKPEIVITVKTAEGLIPLRLEQINAVEYSEHHLVYHLVDNRQIAGLSSRENFDKQATEIAAIETFIKCASSFFVNMKNILSVSHQCFKMKNGAKFPITRKYAATKDVFLKYKFSEREEN